MPTLRADSLIELLERAVRWTDQAELIVLLIIVFFVRAVSHQLKAKQPWPYVARLLASAFLAAYTLHLLHALDHGNDVVGLVLLFVRAALVAYFVFLCVASPITFAVSMFARYVQSEWREFLKWGERLDQERRSRVANAEPRRERSVPRDLELRRAAEEARLNHERQCQIIRAAGLAEDEQEAALTQARQKYLQALNDLLQ